MRKRICTATIFAAMIGAAVLSIIIKARAYCWWMPGVVLSLDNEMPIIGWVAFNVGLPIVGAWLAHEAFALLWGIAEDCCFKLRGESKTVVEQSSPEAPDGN